MKIRFVLTLLFSGVAWAQAPGTFTPTGSMTTPRVFHTATLLTNGKVLIAGWSTVCYFSGCFSAASGEL
jgi:hypothetical protein